MQRHMLGRGISSSWKGRTSSGRGVRGPCNGDGGLRSPASRAFVFPPRGAETRRRAVGRRGAGQHGATVQARADHAGEIPAGDGRGPQARGPGGPGERRQHLRDPRGHPDGCRRLGVRPGAPRGADPRGVPPARAGDAGRPPRAVRGRPRRLAQDREEGGGMAGAPRAARSSRKAGDPRGRRRSAPASPGKGLRRIGIVDTSFARYDMAAAAVDELRKQGGGFSIERYTVPGIKDLAAGAKILLDRGCDIVLALGMVGRQPVDKDCALAADFGLQLIQATVGRHILGVMVHEDEATDEAQLAWLFDRRTREHAINAYNLLFRPEAMRARAGTGQREGFFYAGPATTALYTLSLPTLLAAPARS